MLPSPAPSTPDNLPLYVDGEDLSHLILLDNVTGGGVDAAVAGINMVPPTATQQSTWGAVKNLW